MDFAAAKKQDKVERDHCQVIRGALTTWHGYGIE